MNIPLKISRKTQRVQKTKQDNVNNMYISVKVNRSPNVIIQIKLI